MERININVCTEYDVRYFSFFGQYYNVYKSIQTDKPSQTVTLLSFIIVFMIMCVSPWCFTDELEDPIGTEHKFVIWRCIWIKGEVSWE